MKRIKLNLYICINKVRENMHKSKVLFPKTFSPFLFKLSKSFFPFCKNIRCINSIYAKTQICIYKLKIFLPLFVNHQQRSKNQINNKDIYAIYIHEEEDAKLTFLHTCITWRRDDKALTYVRVKYVMHKWKSEAPPTHVYRIKKSCQPPQYKIHSTWIYI